MMKLFKRKPDLYDICLVLTFTWVLGLLLLAVVMR